MRDTWLIVIFFKAGLLASAGDAAAGCAAAGCAAGAYATTSRPSGARDVAFLVAMPCPTRNAAWQGGHAVRRHARSLGAWSLGHALDVDALEQLARGDAVAHRRHVACHCAVAERHHDLAARSRDLRELEVVLAADRALDHGHVDALGPLLRVDQRAKDDVRFVEHSKDSLVNVE